MSLIVVDSWICIHISLLLPFSPTHEVLLQRLYATCVFV